MFIIGKNSLQKTHHYKFTIHYKKNSKLFFFASFLWNFIINKTHSHTFQGMCESQPENNINPRALIDTQI